MRSILSNLRVIILGRHGCTAAGVSSSGEGGGRGTGVRGFSSSLMATETDARAGRAHPEAELVAAAGESDGTRVKLCITNVYNSSSSEVLSLATTNTVGDLKALIEASFAGRPSPHQQRLIFRGKQCEEGQQLGHVLRGVSFNCDVLHAWSRAAFRNSQ